MSKYSEKAEDVLRGSEGRLTGPTTLTDALEAIALALLDLADAVRGTKQLQLDDLLKRLEKCGHEERMNKKGDV